MNEDIKSNAGRCDWCGKPVDMSSGDRLMLSSREDIELEGFEEHGFEISDAIEATADAIERAGGPKDEMLADIYRENGEFRLHGECYDESALSEIHGFEESG